jgi:pyruvate,water dikinase
VSRPLIFRPEPGRTAPGREEIGGKAAALAALAAVRGPGGAAPEVPRWVVLCTYIFESLAGPAMASAGDAVSRRAAVMAIEPPGHLRLALLGCLDFAGLYGRTVAVRSSAAAEDGTHASFAGQYESVLGVPVERDTVALWDAIRRVWASTLSAHAAAYGESRSGTGPSMAVLIQEMVEPVAAGVAFDADPVTGDRDTVVVSAVWGLGESLVSGEGDADTFRLSLEGGEWRVHERAIANKTQAIVARGGTTERVTLPPERANSPALDEPQAAQVAAWTRAVSQAFGVPQDIEWALAGSPPRVVLLQARPITTLAAAADATPGAPAGLAAERRVWDNSNIVESYAGVTTPLTFTFARAVYEDVYRQFCRLMGVPGPLLESHGHVFANMLGLVRGRVYYQLLNWYRTLGLLPGFAFNRGFMEKMMGVRERLEDPPAPPGSGDRLRDLARFVAMAGRMVRESSKLKREVPAFHTQVEGVIGPLADEDLARRPPAELAALYRRLERELLAHWRAPLVNDFFAMMFFGILCRLIERWLPGAPPTLANDLLCGEGGIISTEPARAVMALAREAAADPALRTALLSESSAANRWSWLHAEPRAAYAARLDAYVARFGDRCMNELKLETVTLRDDPGFLLGMIRAYLEQGMLDPDATRAREREIRAAAEARVRATLRGPVRAPKRALFRWVLGQARVRVRDRENLRFERTRVFGVVRRLFLALGGHLSAAGRLAERRDVFLLTLEELLADAEGRAPEGGYARRIVVRRARFDAWSRSPAPPDRFETCGEVGDWLAHDPPELAALAPAVPPGGDTLQGLGCCPGVVRARVRVVHDPSQARDLAGRILVAERTDPGWTLIFPAVAGLLVQRGSLLSHSAIVAREMGIPCVVGIPHLLDTLHDGDEVELDGTTGAVRRLSAAEVA